MQKAGNQPKEFPNFIPGQFWEFQPLSLEYQKCQNAQLCLSNLKQRIADQHVCIRACVFCFDVWQEILHFKKSGMVNGVKWSRYR